jgi:hypothetical protein
MFTTFHDIVVKLSKFLAKEVKSAYDALDGYDTDGQMAASGTEERWNTQ